MKRLLLACCLLFALVATQALAQATPLFTPAGAGNTTVLPIWNLHNGQVDGLMLIEPSGLPVSPSQRVIRPVNGRLQLRAGLSLEANPGMGVLCNDSGVASGLNTMAGHCMLVDLGAQPGARNNVKGIVQAQRGRSTLTGALALGNDTLGFDGALGKSAADQRLLESLLGPGGATLDRRNASLIGQVSLGKQSWVSIGGTLARVRMIPTEQLRGGVVPPEWDAGSLSLGGGVGNFGGEITGQMIEVPGQPSRFSTLGAGVTWRTPWKAKLSVGAENLMSRGKNPFGTENTRPPQGKDEGSVPYVRYQQDL